ncbi:MAG: hypothetical protein IJX77_10355 [Ruminococcus sp.]|nr:hypothetical protein [Ruminococcus sp.]
MTAQQIKSRISEICSHFTFEYNEKNCGVDPFSQHKFDMWCGDNTYSANSIDEVMNLPFFDGKSLDEIATEIDIIDW